VFLNSTHTSSHVISDCWHIIWQTKQFHWRFNCFGSTL